MNASNPTHRKASQMPRYIMVLNDGETFCDLYRCQIMQIPDDSEQFDTESIETALDDETLPVAFTFGDELPPALTQSPADASATEQLLAIHRYLYPERYEEGREVHEWDASTIEQVAAMVESGLKGDHAGNAAEDELPARLRPSDNVWVVDVFEREDGIYLFAEEDDAKAFFEIEPATRKFSCDPIIDSKTAQQIIAEEKEAMSN